MFVTGCCARRRSAIGRQRTGGFHSGGTLPRCRSRHPETGGVRSLPSSAETVGAGRSHVRPDRNSKTAKHISKSRCLRANDIRVHIRPLLESQRRASIAVGRETSNPGRAWMASWTVNTGLREFGVAGGSGGLRLLAHDLDGRELVTDPWPLVVEAAVSVTVHVRTHEGAPAAEAGRGHLVRVRLTGSGPVFPHAAGGALGRARREKTHRGGRAPGCLLPAVGQV